MSAVLFCLFDSTQTPASQLDRSTPPHFNALASYALVENVRESHATHESNLLRNTQQRQNVLVQHFVTLNSS